MTIIQYALFRLGLKYILDKKTLRNKTWALVLHDRFLSNLIEEIHQQAAMAARDLANDKAT